MKSLRLWPALLAFLIATQAYAGGSYGIKGGLNLATVGIKPKREGFDNGYRPGVAFGGFLMSQDTGGIGIRLELLYLQKGEEYKYDFEFMGHRFRGEGSERLDYIALPIFMVIPAGGKGGLKRFIELGPEFALNISARNGNGDNIKKDVSNMDIGLNLGFGVAWGRLHSDIRYSIGLLNMSKHSSQDSYAKNRCIQLLVGYAFKSAPPGSAGSYYH